VSGGPSRDDAGDDASRDADATGPPYSTDPAQLEKEIVLTVYRASGPGGQHRNTTDSSVRIHHRPSGLTVIATEHRSQLSNRRLAMERLIARLTLLNRPRKKRLPTRQTRAAKEARLRAKRLQAERKQGRGRPRDED
jgi:protein subunit release factor B